MSQTEKQILNKTKRLLRRKLKKLRGFENLILDQNFINVIYAIEEVESDLQDLIIFSSCEDLRDIEETAADEVQVVEESKDKVVAELEKSIRFYKSMQAENALRELETMIAM